VPPWLPSGRQAFYPRPARLGDFEAGAVAAVAGPRFSVLSGGLRCMLAIGLLALAVPAFRQWTLPPRDVSSEVSGQSSNQSVLDRIERLAEDRR